MAKKTSKKETKRPRASKVRVSPQAPERFRRTREDHAAEMGEDYVELIDDLLTGAGEARLVDIAEHMGVSHVTASRIIARLRREGLVETKPYRAIFLTDSGKNLAEQTRARHQLVFKLLRVIGVPEHQAHLDAEGIEHHISEVSLNAISQFLKIK